MKTGIKEIDDYLRESAEIHQYDNVEALIKDVLQENYPDDFIKVVEDKILYVNLEKGYTENDAVLKLLKIDKFIKIFYINTSDEYYDDIKFIKQVFPHPKKTIKYL